MSSKTKKLVAYFSCTGTTAVLARTLAETVQADLFEIKPKTPYTEADLDWTDNNSRSSLEMKDAASRPEIAEKLDNMSDYDVVFIGFPIWWYVAPTIINTFLESYDFSGKTIITFATSGSSDMGRTDSILRNICTDSTSWRRGKRFRGNVKRDELSGWIENLNI